MDRPTQRGSEDGSAVSPLNGRAVRVPADNPHLGTASEPSSPRSVGPCGWTASPDAPESDRMQDSRGGRRSAVHPHIPSSVPAYRIAGTAPGSSDHPGSTPGADVATVGSRRHIRVCHPSEPLDVATSELSCSPSAPRSVRDCETVPAGDHVPMAHLRDHDRQGDLLPRPLPGIWQRSPRGGSASGTWLTPPASIHTIVAGWTDFRGAGQGEELNHIVDL